MVIECRVEELNPEVVGVVHSREAEREAAARAGFGGQAFFVYGVDVEWGIGQDEVELTGALVQIFLVGDGFPDVAFQSMDGQVHAAELDGVADFFLAVNGEF